MPPSATGFLLPVRYANGGEIPVSMFANLGVEPVALH